MSDDDPFLTSLLYEDESMRVRPRLDQNALTAPLVRHAIDAGAALKCFA